MVLVHFPDEGQFMLDEFVAMQQEAIKVQGLELMKYHDKIKEGIEQILSALRNHTLESD